jgi:hypothetical protein
MSYERDKTEIKCYEVLKKISNAGIDGLSPKDLFANGKGVFGKNRNYLFYCLNDLKAKNLVWFDRSSRKYKVTFEDKQILELLSKHSTKLDKAFEEENLPFIRNVSKNANVDSFYEFVLYEALFRFLKGMEDWLLLEDKWKGHAYNAILKYDVDYFSKLLGECFNANSEALGKAMKKVFASLDSKRKKKIVDLGIQLHKIPFEK